MDTLPSEILILIFLHLPDLASISAAIHASPLCYRAFLIAREQILTNATLSEVSSRGITFNEPCHWAEYTMYEAREGKIGFEVLDVRAAIQILFHQLCANKAPRLRVEQCMTLLALEYIRQFRLGDGCEDWDFPDTPPRSSRWEPGGSEHNLSFHLVVFERRWIDPGGNLAATLKNRYGPEWSDSESRRGWRKEWDSKIERIRMKMWEEHRERMRIIESHRERVGLERSRLPSD